MYCSFSSSKLCLSRRYFQTTAPSHNVKIIYDYTCTEPIPRHHHSLSAHLLLKCWNVSGTSSWWAVLSGHSAAGGRMRELCPYPPFNTHTHTHTHTHAITKTQVHTCFHPVTTRHIKWNESTHTYCTVKRHTHSWWMVWVQGGVLGTMGVKSSVLHFILHSNLPEISFICFLTGVMLRSVSPQITRQICATSTRTVVK